MDDETATTPILADRGEIGFQDLLDPPRICIAPARAMYLGPGLDLAPHLNVARTIAVALDGRMELRQWTRGTGWSAWSAGHVADITSQTLHHLRSTGGMAFLYLDPLGDGRRALDAKVLAQGRERMLGNRKSLDIEAAFAAFGLWPRRPADGRIARVVAEIDRRPSDFSHLRDAAALACLSPSRFRARFAREVGLPFRPYRLWRRMAAVARALADGSNLTQAAHAAGFSSSAHLSSAFKRMFGLPPSQLLALGLKMDIA